MQRTFRVTILALGLLGLLAAPALADPPGNNGTVKVDGVAFDQHPDNEPHVGCVFEIDFYGYDEGVGSATATFKLQPPSGTSTLFSDTIDIGEDAAGGGTDLDAELLVDLSGPLSTSGAFEHPIQGFHIKLTVNAPGSIGADVKHKVFWVTCDYAPSPQASELTGGQVPVEFAGGSIAPLLVVALVTIVAGVAGARVAYGRVNRRS